MYKLRLKKLEIEDEEPWKQHFTLYTDRWTGSFKSECGRVVEQRFAPYWECNDPSGKCKGNKLWAEVFPAGYTTSDNLDEEGRVVEHGVFVFDEGRGPQMNGATLTVCPNCNGGSEVEV
jgi:hypothetical protein